MYYTTEAIILKKKESGEADNIIVCYSREFGKINVLAKGARKQESKLKCHLEPMTYSKISFVNKRRMILVDAETIDSFFAIKNDFKKLNAGLFILNLIDKAISGEEKDENIFVLMIDFFKKISLEKDLELRAAYFELEFLKLLGYAPNRDFLNLEKNKNSSDVFISVNNFFGKIIGEKLTGLFLKI